MQLTIKLQSYIASPYWPAREKLVSIIKSSGFSRARSEEKREQALLRYLERTGMSQEDFKKLEEEAARPWYRNDKGKIVIPSHQFASCLVQGARSAPAGARMNPDQLRSIIRVNDLVTDKTQADEKFERFVLPKDGKGMPLSNQRRFSSDEVIKDTVATGTLEFDPADVKPSTVQGLVKYCGKWIGVGGSRKMGFGRFTVVE